MPSPPSLRRLTLLVVLTNIVPPLSIDEYTPALPAMARDLGGSAAAMQFSVSIYMLGFAISQFIGGFLSDAFGRRRPLLAVTPLYFAATLLCLFAESTGALLAGRFLQGLGVGVLALTGPAIMADAFRGPALTRVSSTYTTVYSFIPIAAPIIGGYLTEWAGWRANFALLLALSVAIYAAFAFLLPETRPAGAASSARQTLAGYRAVLGQRDFRLASLGMVLTWSLVAVFSVMAPFLIQNVLGYSPSAYGWMALFVGAGFLVGNLANGALLAGPWAGRLLWLGHGVMILGSAALLVAPLAGLTSAPAIIAPVFVVMAGGGIVFPQLFSRALAAAAGYGGIAGALVGTLILGGAVAVTFAASRLRAHSAVDLAAIFLACSLAALGVSAAGFARRPRVS